MAELKEYMHLKSGTDIRGVASEGAGESVELTDEKVYSITRAFVKWLLAKSGKQALTVSVGHDSRISAERIKKQVVDALVSGGVHVIDCSLCSTPAMFMTTVDLDCDGAVQITASHHPWHRNGLKFFTRDGGLDSCDIEEILVSAFNGEGIEARQPGTVENKNYLDMYCVRLRKMICDGVQAENYEKPLAGYKIAVDAGNGVGGFYAHGVLEPLGADVSGSRFLEPDGMFPNHIPNPEKAEAMDAISDAVISSGSDFGVIFDTDVDRAACVDETGKEINRNRLVALAAAVALEGNAGGTIVTDSVTSDGLKTFIEQELGGVHWRFKRGYKNVINEQIRLNGEGVNCPLAIETSGHAALRENYYLDDGAYLITKFIIKMAQLGKEGKKLDSLISALKEPAEAKEYRFKILQEDFRSCGNAVIAQLEKYSAENGFVIADDNREGIRVSIPECKGWFLLRLSVHDPIMPMNIESDVEGGVQAIADRLVPFFEKCGGLDISPIK
ncbi:MAG: phosphomannomutase/phosphoglucomutase [Clostridia bacterium]|nr:phosphomannomutase/phosphoglucomutase [Clostridia bacterium]